MGRVTSFGQFGDIEPGPQSRQVDDTGHEWLNDRSDAGAIDAAFNAAHRQDIQKQLGGEPWLRQADMAPTIEGERQGSRRTGVSRVLDTQRRSEGKERAGLNWKVRNEDDSPEILGGPAPTSEPVKHVFRSMREDEFQQAHERGFFQSDGRGAIEPDWEGTNAAVEPASAYSYSPRDSPARMVKLAVHPDDGWFTATSDNYARTRQRIPLDRMVANTEPYEYGKAPGAGVRDHVVALQKAKGV